MWKRKLYSVFLTRARSTSKDVPKVRTYRIKVAPDKKFSWRSLHHRYAIPVVCMCFCFYYFNNFLEPFKAKKGSKPSPKKPSKAIKRFEAYATMEYNDNLYMTPKAFLNSVVQEGEPQETKLTKVTFQQREAMLEATPRIYNISDVEEKNLFWRLGDHGMLSYADYLFLLSVLTTPESGLKIAFDLVDVDRDEKISRDEFWRLRKMAYGYAQRQKNIELWYEDDTTLSVHLCGKNRGLSEPFHDLTFPEFRSFILSFQYEALKAEFMAHTANGNTISYQNFAKILTRFLPNSLKPAEKLPQEQGEKCEITFDNYMDFMRLLSDLDDLPVSFMFYNFVAKPISRKEFRMAANICLRGEKLPKKMVDVVFDIFGKNDMLPTDEFIHLLKSRKKRKVDKNWEGHKFQSCFYNEMRRRRERLGSI